MCKHCQAVPSYFQQNVHQFMAQAARGLTTLVGTVVQPDDIDALIRWQPKGTKNKLGLGPNDPPVFYAPHEVLP